MERQGAGSAEYMLAKKRSSMEDMSDLHSSKYFTINAGGRPYVGMLSPILASEVAIQVPNTQSKHPTCQCKSQKSQSKHSTVNPNPPNPNPSPQNLNPSPQNPNPSIRQSIQTPETQSRHPKPNPDTRKSSKIPENRGKSPNPSPDTRNSVQNHPCGALGRPGGH